MHIESHVAACAEVFGLKRMDNTGRTYGEGVEHPWRDLNKLRAQVRESGHGARRDLLNDHLRFWNWLKTLGLGLFSIIFSRSP